MKRKKVRGSVLADGELTGHAHRLVDAIDVYEREDGVREFEVAQETTVTHEEHKPATIAPGKWKSDVVRETDPFEGERRVAD